jgi:hypothetical protein
MTERPAGSVHGSARSTRADWWRLGSSTWPHLPEAAAGPAPWHWWLRAGAFLVWAMLVALSFRSANVSTWATLRTSLSSLVIASAMPGAILLLGAPRRRFALTLLGGLCAAQLLAGLVAGTEEARFVRDCRRLQQHEPIFAEQERFSPIGHSRMIYIWSPDGGERLMAFD